MEYQKDTQMMKQSESSELVRDENEMFIMEEAIIQDTFVVDAIFDQVHKVRHQTLYFLDGRRPHTMCALCQECYLLMPIHI